MADQICRNKDDAVLQEILDPLHLQMNLADQEEKNEEQSELDKKCKSIEIEAVKLAEVGRIDEAIKLFHQAVDASPHNPSPHNNIAQAYRMKGQIAEAMNHLDKAIILSEGKGKAASQAFVQRAMIHRLNKDEESAKADFTLAASLGSGFAGNQLAQMNPYAAMCNKMLGQVMAKLQRGDPEDMPFPQRPA